MHHQPPNDLTGIARPSKIQTIAYPHILGGASCVLAEQTGSGKTLAYLLPLLQRLRSLEQEGGLGRAPPKAPRVVILAPTAGACERVCFTSRCSTSVSNQNHTSFLHAYIA